jgi:hypothetical protein
MPFRFRRSIRIAPGVRRNIGKSGVSTSVGVRVRTSLSATATPGQRSAYQAAASRYTTTTSRRNGGSRCFQHVTWKQRLLGAAVVLAGGSDGYKGTHRHLKIP